jgi:hypothetical protein
MIRGVEIELPAAAKTSGSSSAAPRLPATDAEADAKTRAEAAAEIVNLFIFSYLKKDKHRILRGFLLPITTEKSIERQLCSLAQPSLLKPFFAYV